MEFNLFGGQQCALFDGRYKIIKDLRRNKEFMYDLKTDPGEQHKLGNSNPQFKIMLDKLNKKRLQLKKASKGKKNNSVSLSKETENALKSLGYIK